jgi:pilus assembly protein CpaB
MRIRIIAVVAALVRAAVGAVVLVVAVRGTAQEAAAGAQTRSVLVVTSEVPSGTSAALLAGSVELRKVPATYIVHGAVSSLAALGGKVSSSTLEPGEQVIASRFATPTELSAAGGTAAVPKGMQQVSVAVDLQRVAAGLVGVGDHVGVYASFSDGGQSTGLLLDHALVTSLTSGAAPSTSTGLGGTTTAKATSGTVLVTLAVTADDAKKLVYAAEFGKIWFSAENADSSAGSAGSVTRTELGG